MGATGGSRSPGDGATGRFFAPLGAAAGGRGALPGAARWAFRDRGDHRDRGEGPATARHSQVWNGAGTPRLLDRACCMRCVIGERMRSAGLARIAPSSRPQGRRLRQAPLRPRTSRGRGTRLRRSQGSAPGRPRRRLVPLVAARLPSLAECGRRYCRGHACRPSPGRTSRLLPPDSPRAGRCSRRPGPARRPGPFVLDPP